MKHGACAIIPLALGAALYGLAFGVLAAQTGFPWWGVAAMGAFVHAGSSQIVAVDRLADGASLISAVLAGGLLNLRYIGIIASLAPVLKDAPVWQRLTAIHITGDENWALTMAERHKGGEAGLPFLAGSGLVMISIWTGSTALGAWVGQVVPDLERWGLGFAFTAAFIAMARGMWPGKTALLPWLTSFGVTLALCTLSLPTPYALIAGCGVGLMLSAWRRHSGGWLQWR